ncbi:amino acid adenylation domain-containing protein [Anabaena cylindrica UHCC 0172]|uniref:non-ribosomal peptide synthetase n=1 Tax=Anabaena cylindrica TaxID=1165 RepID=UPI002B1EC34D|nr:amino acid adenylation domain-containing protein [Anabaena cylindrica]MEA5552712.1 amino acid adenylation domain-containing protein [Anabaena cylindrica UHCC 0172]
MKNIHRLLSECIRLDVKLWVQGHELRYSVPKRLISSELLAEIREHKAEIIQFLQTTNLATSPHLESIQPVPRDAAIPLSFAQQRIWLISQIEDINATYNLSGTLKINGALQVPILEQSIREIIQRHEILRTTLGNINGQGIQVISPTVNFTLPLLDWRSLSPANQIEAREQLIIQAARQPFDLTKDLLWRCTLLQIGQTEYLLQIVMHHTVSDGWSLGVFFRELNAIYTALSQGKNPPLAELAIQYADFSVWQRQQLQGEYLAQQLSYWKQQLQGANTFLQLPSNRPRPPLQTFIGKSQSFTLDHNLTSALQTLAQNTGVTLFMLLLAGFKTLLYRYTQQTDILVGSPIANRNHSQTEGLIGCFVNILLLRTDLSGNPNFRELLNRVRAMALSAYAHQDLPFEKLVEELQPTRDLSYSPLFQVMFILQNAFDTKDIQLGDLNVQSSQVDTHTSQFDLTMEFTQQDWGLVGRVEYKTDLFDEQTIARFIAHFQTLLAGIVAHPEQCLSDLPLLTPGEYLQLQQWNQTQIDYPPNICIHQLFAQQVERTPDAVALVFENEQLTYRELNIKANQLAHHLQKLGVQPEILVGICVTRSLEMVIGILGILKAGGAYVPLDPTYPLERLEFMLADAQVPLLLTQTPLLKTLPTHSAQVICLDTDWDQITPHNQQNPDSGVSNENLIYVIYTSGSTGKPKGTMNTHKGLCNRLLWMQDTYKLTPQDRVLQKTPFSFDVSVWEFFWPLITGAKLVIAQPGGHQDSAYLVQLIAQEQITTVHFVPSMLQVFLEESGLAACSCLKRVICSGEALAKTLQDRFFARLDVELHNLYGPTEAAIDVTFWECQRHSQLPIVPIGRPISNTQIYILDGQGKPTPVGVPGELHIGGVGLARGYLNRPDLTKEKFIPHPLHKSPSDRLYKTGDLARYLPSGEIEYIGRIDNQIKLRGFRIELGEIESVIRQHPQVREVVVMAREEVPGNQYLVAYIVPDLNTNIVTSELRAFLGEKLPEYMLPTTFVNLATLPFTPNGKINRKALPVPDNSRNSQVVFVLPRTSTEKILAAIYADVLGLEKVSIDDNFFALGGHSLLATKVISRLREAFKIELPLRSLFERPTVANLAERVETISLALTQVSRSFGVVEKGRKEIEL